MYIYHYSIPAAQVIGILGSALLSGTYNPIHNTQSSGVEHNQ